MAEFVYITDDTYTKKQVLRMEHLVLKVLSFDLAAPTIVQFLTQYFLRQRVCNKVESLSMVSEVLLGVLKVLAICHWLVTVKFSLFEWSLSETVSPSQFLGELSLVDADPFLKYLPSQIAAAAFILANYTIAGTSWVSWTVQINQKWLPTLYLGPRI